MSGGGRRPRVRLTDEQRDRAASCVGLAKSVALSLAGTMSHADLDDLVGVAFVGLIRAAETFDPGHGSPFSGYAYRAARSAALNELEARRRPARRAFSLNGLDVACDPATGRADPEDLAALPAFLGRLGPKERAVLGLRFGLEGGGPRSFEEVGRAFGFSKQRAQQVESAALARLRAMYHAPAATTRRRASA